MRRAVPFALLLACASSPPRPSERPLGGTQTVQKGDASLELRSYYSVKPDRSVEIVAELTGAGAGAVGPIALELKADGFLHDGPSTWTGEPGPGKTRATFVLRPQGDGGKWVKLRMKQGDSESAVFVPMLVTPDEIRLCQADDEPCKGVRDPDAATP